MTLFRRVGGYFFLAHHIFCSFPILNFVLLLSSVPSEATVCRLPWLPCSSCSLPWPLLPRLSVRPIQLLENKKSAAELLTAKLQRKWCYYLSFIASLACRNFNLTQVKVNVLSVMWHVFSAFMIVKFFPFYLWQIMIRLHFLFLSSCFLTCVCEVCILFPRECIKRTIHLCENRNISSWKLSRTCEGKLICSTITNA